MTFPVVGMVGGGQLARMTHEAGIPLGVRFKLLSDTPQDSAAQVVSDVTVGDYRDLDTLRAFAAGCDVITFDHEHVPTEHLRALEADGIPVRPGPDALVHAQDKGVMRARLAEIGAPCPRNRIVADPADAARFAAEVGGFPIVLKTVRGGYDGKGVWVVDSQAEAAEPFRAGVPVLAEEKVGVRPGTGRQRGALAARPGGGLPRGGVGAGGRRVRHRDRARAGPVGGAVRAGTAAGADAGRGAWRGRAPGGGAVRDRGRAGAGQRAGDAPAQQRPLDASRAPSPRSSPTTCGRCSTSRSATPARARPGR